MTNTEKVLVYLRSIAPNEASNEQILKSTGVQPHQQVFQITKKLLDKGIIEGSRAGGTWHFRTRGQRPEPVEQPLAVARAEPDVGQSGAAREFEQLARQVMSEHYDTPLAARRLAGVPKTFDLVSDDGALVGDAKFFTLVGGTRLPPAKFSVIAEHVWLLEKTGAPRTFLVFGNDRRVPLEWLSRYGKLLSHVEFYFLEKAGGLECLTKTTPTSSDTKSDDPDAGLKKAFHEEMVGIYFSALRECGYRATRFLQSVERSGGFVAAKELLHKPGISEGLTTLWECGRLDLSMEALVLREPWLKLFTEQELDVARGRLKQLKGSGS